MLLFPFWSRRQKMRQSPIHLNILVIDYSEFLKLISWFIIPAKLWIASPNNIIQPMLWIFFTSTLPNRNMSSTFLFRDSLLAFISEIWLSEFDAISTNVRFTELNDVDATIVPTPGRLPFWSSLALTRLVIYFISSLIFQTF